MQVNQESMFEPYYKQVDVELFETLLGGLFYYLIQSNIPNFKIWIKKGPEEQMCASV